MFGLLRGWDERGVGECRRRGWKCAERFGLSKDAVWCETREDEVEI